MRRPGPARVDQRRRFGLAALMLGAGAMHFVSPRFFDELIPAALPGRSGRGPTGRELPSWQPEP